MEAFWDALENMYEKHSASSAAAGEQATRGLWVFSHDTAKGNAHAYKLFELIKVKPCGQDKEPRCFEDYEANIDYPGKPADPKAKCQLGVPQPLTDFARVHITRLV